jgi:hypothetical protein
MIGSVTQMSSIIACGVKKRTRSAATVLHDAQEDGEEHEQGRKLVAPVERRKVGYCEQSLKSDHS